jgi:hypothetical protein
VLVSFTGYGFPQPARPDSVVEAEIARSIEEINQAFVARDFRTFEKYYSDRFVSVRSQPVYNSKQQLVAMLKADAAVLSGGGRLDFATLSYENDKPEIRIFGNTAVVNVAKRNLWSYHDQKCLSRYQATETWVATDAGWRLLASHSSTFQCARVPWVPLHKAVAAIGTVMAPPTLTEADLPVKAIFEKSETSRRVYAPGFTFTDLEGAVKSGQAATVPAAELIASEERDNEAVVSSGDTAIFLFRTFRKKGTLRVAVQVSVTVARTDNKWRLVAAHATW